MLVNWCYAGRFNYFGTYKQLVKGKKYYSAHRNYYSYSEDGLKRLTTEHINKFSNEADDQSLFENAHSIVKGLLSDTKIAINPLVGERNIKILDYNNYGSGLKRFNIFLNTYRTLAPKDMLFNEHILRVSTMAYLTHTITSIGVMIDDVLDEGNLRRNKLPWYKIAGKDTVLDVSLLYCGVFVVMKNIFEKEPYYVRCVELLNEAAWLISVGESLDLRSFDIITRHREYFNMETYKQLCFGKMTGNGFYMPIVTAMYMANHDFSNYSEKLLKILDHMGYYSMVENDYCDRYGKKTGKLLDDDIRGGKLTWLLLTAIDIANDSQKEIITQCYGKNDTDCVKAIVNLYDELKLEEINTAKKKEIYQNIDEEIKTIPDPRVQNVLMHSNRLIKNWYIK